MKKFFVETKKKEIFTLFDKTLKRTTSALLLALSLLALKFTDFFRRLFLFVRRESFHRDCERNFPLSRGNHVRKVWAGLEKTPENKTSTEFEMQTLSLIDSLNFCCKSKCGWRWKTHFGCYFLFRLRSALTDKNSGKVYFEPDIQASGSGFFPRLFSSLYVFSPPHPRSTSFHVCLSSFISLIHGL